jgi:hypothetical protein
MNWRNGTRDRLLATKAGDVDVKIPKLRRAASSRRSWNVAAASTGLIRGGDGGVRARGVDPQGR